MSINRIFKSKFIKNEKKFFEKYVWSSILLNAILIPLTGIYELGLTHSIYGTIVGIIFLLTFFCNLGLIYLNERYIDKTIQKERRLHLLTYGYLIFAIFSVITLIVSSNVGGIKRHVFNPLYYFLWIYGFAISYFDLTILISKHRIKYEDPI